MPPNPPRSEPDKGAPAALTTEAFQKHYGRGSAAFSGNAPLSPNRHSPAVPLTQNPHASHGHFSSAGAHASRHPSYHPHSHSGHPPQPRAPHSSAQHGHRGHQGHPGYVGPPQSWNYHYNGRPHAHDSSRATVHHQRETSSHSPYTHAPSQHRSFPESRILRTNTPIQDNEKKSKKVTKDKSPSPTERVNPEATDVRKGSTHITAEDISRASSDPTDPRNSSKESTNADAVTGEVTETKRNEVNTNSEPSPPQADSATVDEPNSSDAVDIDSAKKSSVKDTDTDGTADEAASSNYVEDKEENLLDDEEELRVEPMKQDFHFFAMENYEATNEDCRRKVENEKIDVDGNDGDKESDRLFIQTTLLNSQLLSKWENATPATRALYMRKEEADRKRFMSEEEIASRHCATLTARKRSPKTPVSVVDMPAKRSNDGFSNDTVEGTSIKRIKVE
ncbi:hypothetical protein ACHAXS_000853 [Conticribra weissflogii]